MASEATAADASNADDNVLGGEDIQVFFEPRERAPCAVDAGSMTDLLASGVRVSISAYSTQRRPLDRTVLHWASIWGNPAAVSAVLRAVAASVVATASDGVPGAEGEANSVDPATAEAVAILDALIATCVSATDGPEDMFSSSPYSGTWACGSGYHPSRGWSGG